MAQRPTHVPKFGDWTIEQDTPYTTVFENARVGRGVGGKIINPNDPEENPTGFAHVVQRNNIAAQLPRKNSGPEDSIPGRSHPSPRRGTDSELNPTHVSKPHHEKRSSKEDGGIRRHVESASPGRRGLGQSPGHRYANNKNLHTRDCGTGEHHYQSQDQSPAHHLYRGFGNKPGAEGKFSPSTTGQKSQGGNIQTNETLGRGAPLPSVGALIESSPESHDGYTYIFNKAREEKQTRGTTKIPTIPPETPPRDISNKQESVPSQRSSSCCCFKPGAAD